MGEHANYKIEERTQWRRWVTPKPLESKPIHRWYVFPHSFTSELVHALIDEWGLGPDDRILDPFVGAGTTVLAAKEKGVPATGYDLSPLAVLAARAKVANYFPSRLQKAWDTLATKLEPSQWDGAVKAYSELVSKALPGKVLGAFEAVGAAIDSLAFSSVERDFFRVAVLAILPKYSRAVATGGWLKWVQKRSKSTSVLRSLRERVELMLEDLRGVRLPRRSLWQVGCADARWLPDRAPTYSAVITSPPYPNRHDYTRVFGVELMFGFMDWHETRKLRYQSFHSHPEARPHRPAAHGYARPQSLSLAVEQIRKTGKDPRVPLMVEGYFLDMYLCLREVERVCRPGAKIGFVLGNAQYCGIPIFVDELTAEIGEQTGLTCQKLVITRYRGNSAQQMGKYGRTPSRESIVVFRKPVFQNQSAGPPAKGVAANCAAKVLQPEVEAR